MRLSKWQTWWLLLFTAVASMLLRIFGTSYIQEGAFSIMTQNVGTILLGAPYYSSIQSAIILITVTLFLGAIYGILLWLALTLAQKADIHFLVWNAPFHKNSMNACLIPGTIIGSIIGLSSYALLSLLFDKEYIYRIMTHSVYTTFNFALLYRLILTTLDALTFAFYILLATSFILWLVTRIQALSRATAIATTVILTGLLLAVSFFSYFNAINPNSLTPTILYLMLIAFEAMAVSWTLIRYSFEACAYAYIIAALLVQGLYTMTIL